MVIQHRLQAIEAAVLFDLAHGRGHADDDVAEADPLARLDADFALMSDALTELQDRVVDVFGGEAAD